MDPLSEDLLACLDNHVLANLGLEADTRTDLEERMCLAVDVLQKEFLSPRKRAKGATGDGDEPAASTTPLPAAPPAGDEVPPTLVASPEDPDAILRAKTLEWGRSDSTLAHGASFDDSTADGRVCKAGLVGSFANPKP